MIGVIEYKHDAEAAPFPVGIGNARINSRNIVVEAVRNVAKPKRDGKPLPVKSDSVYFTLKGAMSYGDANWNALHYGYLRHVQNVIRIANASYADYELYRVRTFNTKNELAAYLQGHGLNVKFTADEPVVPSVNLAEGEYSLADILQLAGSVGDKEKVAVADVKVKIGVAAQNNSNTKLDDEELRTVFKAMMNNLPAQTATILFQKGGTFTRSLETLANTIDHKINTTNFSVTVAKK